MTEHSIGRAPRVLLPIVLCIALAGATWSAFQSLYPPIVESEMFDYWFESDAPLVFEEMVGGGAKAHAKTARHPLFSLSTNIPLRVVRRVAGLSDGNLAGAFLGGTAALFGLVFFATMRAIGHGPGAAFAFTVLASTTAAAVFSLPVPGQYALGCVSILTAVWVTALRDAGRSVPDSLLIAIGAGTLAFSTTNWVAGLLALLMCRGPRRGAALAAASFVLVAALWLLQHWLIPDTKWFLAAGDAGRFLFHPLAGGPLAVTRVFLVSSVVFPGFEDAWGLSMSAQRVPLPSAALPAAASLAWVAVLAAGGALSWRCPAHRTASLILLTVAAQLALHLAFGEETFTFSMHWAPLLVALVAAASLGARPPPLAAGALGLALLLGVNNFGWFAKARESLLRRSSERSECIAAVQELTRDDDLLVRGDPPQAAFDARIAPRALADLQPGGVFPFGRKGWHLTAERVDLGAIETLRARGATHFVSEAELRLDLDGHYRRLHRSARCMLYDLRAPSEPAGAGRPLPPS